MNILCPKCKHIGHLDDFFMWAPDSDGHPTIDIMTCPKCLCSNIPYRGDVPMRDERGRFIKYPERVDFDDFLEIDSPGLTANKKNTMTKQDYTPDWASIEPMFKYVAVDLSGLVFGYIRRPEQSDEEHIMEKGDRFFPIHIDRIDPPGENWKTMIYERPDGQ